MAASFTPTFMDPVSAWDYCSACSKKVQTVADDDKWSVSFEVISGAAALTAFKKFEESGRASGAVQTSAYSKWALANMASAEARRIVDEDGYKITVRSQDLARHIAAVWTDRLYDQRYKPFTSFDPSKSTMPDFDTLMGVKAES